MIRSESPAVRDARGDLEALLTQWEEDQHGLSTAELISALTSACFTRLRILGRQLSAQEPTPLVPLPNPPAPFGVPVSRHRRVVRFAATQGAKLARRGR
jgi:hypothetical protein